MSKGRFLGKKGKYIVIFLAKGYNHDDFLLYRYWRFVVLIQKYKIDEVVESC